MALQLVSLGRSKQPMYNEYAASAHFESNVHHITDNLFKRAEQTPELVAMIDTAVTDHFKGPVDWFDANGRALGPTKYNQIKLFWENNEVQESFGGQGVDYFMDGSCFGWHVSANAILTAKQKEVLAAAFAKMKALGVGVGSFADEAANMPRKIGYLPASTISIKHDETGIIYYKQEVAGKVVRWEPDQVVHIRLMDWNGRVRGFSPLKALAKEIVMMYMLKENIVAKMQNGGSPDYIISLKGANGVSKARFERLRTALESFSHLRKSHGNMPIDAEVDAIPLGTGLADMEYRELAMFLISEFGLALGLPTSRIPFLGTGQGGPSNKGELSGNSEDSYQTKINARRSSWENAWNKVFRKAGFTFKFRRDNLQDSVRETQASGQRAAAVIQIQDSLMKSKKRLTTTAHLELLSGSRVNIAQEDIEDIPEEDLLMQMTAGKSAMAGPGGEMQPGNRNIMSKAGQDTAANKEKTASNNNKQ